MKFTIFGQKVLQDLQTTNSRAYYGVMFIPIAPQICVVCKNESKKNKLDIYIG